MAAACVLTALLPSASALADEADAAAPGAKTEAPTVTTTVPTAGVAGTFLDAMLRELNRVRANKGLPAVRADRRMNGSASGHSRDMARKNYFAHGAWSGRVLASSSRASSVGEVLGWMSRSTPRSEAKTLVQQWLGSSIHRTVLLDGGFRRVGIGRALGTVSGQSAALYTVDFASAR